MDVLSYLLGKNAGGGAKGLKVEVVETLPQTGESNVLYLVPKQTTETSNVFDEYLYINDAWEKIGTTDIDLSGYVTDEELLQALATKQNTMQYSTMPTASADNLGKIVQYTGTTDSTYTNGHFYIVVSDGEEEPTYSWEEVSLGSGDCVGTVITQEDIDSMNQEYNPDWVGTSATTPAFVFVRYGTGIYKFADSVSMRWGKSDRNGVNSSAGAILIVTSNGYENIFIVRSANSYDYLMRQYSTTHSTTPATANTAYSTSSIYDNVISDLFTSRYMTPLNSLPNAKALATNNIQSYTPTGNYHPATKLSSETVPLTLSGLSAYDSNTTYQVGDYVYRSATDLTIYKCNTADTTGTWDSTLWDSKTYIEYLKDALNQ